MAARAIAESCYYRFCNKASQKDLNHYAPGGSNVNVYTEDGSTDQIWFYDGERLFPESNPTKCLDRYVGNNNYNNADVYTPNDPTNQILTFQKVSESNYGFYYYIKVNGYYLTQSGSDVVWTANANGNYSIWLAEEIIKVTNIPYKGTEYFAVWSQFANGTFPSTAETSIDNLYKKCFGVLGEDKDKFYNLYGAIFTGSSPASYKGKFHSGIDIYRAEGTAVKAPVTGTIVYSSLSDYGTVTIKETSTNRLFLCMHMTGLKAVGTSVTAGTTTIGYVGGTGSGGTQAFSPHLHVEAHPAGTTNYGDSYQTNSFNNAGNSIPVHKYF